MLAICEIACVQGSTPWPNGEGQAVRGWFSLSPCEGEPARSPAK